MNHFKQLVFLLGAFLLFGSYMTRAQQLYDYSIVESQTTYTPITGTYIVNGDDNGGTVTLPSGFNFSYDNTKITSIGVHTNGYLSFNKAATDWGPVIDKSTSLIIIHSNDMYVTSQIESKVEGTSPNRVLIIQWSGFGTYDGGCRNDFREVQIRLTETTNAIEIRLGNGWSTYAGGCGITGQLALSGFSSGEYINIKPGSPSTFYKGSNGSQYYLDATARPYLPSGKSYKFLTFPNFTAAYPAQDSIFRKGDVITGVNHPGVKVESYSNNFDIRVNYQIAGPLPRNNPNYRVVYTATEEGNINNINVPITQEGITRFTEAKGVAAGTNPNDGSLNLTNSTIKAGTYEIFASMELIGMNYKVNLPVQTFVIALDDDLAMLKADSPQDTLRKRYPFSQGAIPIVATFVNQGINPIDEFTTTATIYNLQGEKEEEFLYTWKNAQKPLQTGDQVILNYGYFRPLATGFYTVVFTSDLVNAVDQDMTNNRFPRTGSTIFEVSPEFEAAAVSIQSPADEVYLGRPIVPQGLVKNNGVADMSLVPAKFTVIKLPEMDTVFVDNVIIENITNNKYSSSPVVFNNAFIPDKIGTYQACLEVIVPEDLVLENNIFCQEFEVVHSLAGTYTIGTRYAGSSRNFNTIQEAVNQLYLQGITAPVRFELTDANYEVGDYNSDKPALDLRGKIVGASSTNTISFVPANNMNGVKGGIKINLNSAKGIGILFGQASFVGNPYASVNTVPDNLIRDYAQSEGFFIFDGGIAKAINFRLHSSSEFRSVLYLGDGAKNITIKNSVISNYDINEEKYRCDIPNTNFRTGIGFSFEPDLRQDGSTYSSGIILRSIPPIDEKENRNTYNLDTLTSSNNIITGNEIGGFAYGVVSLGMGPLFSQYFNKYLPYYNSNNLIEGNVIRDVAKAGIFLGYESNTKVVRNVIFNVLGGCTGPVAGILAGGAKGQGNVGYNNTNLVIDGNEISNVSSEEGSMGIKIEQERHQFFQSGKPVYFPIANAKSTIINNIIRNLVVREANAERYGIVLTTVRATPATPLTGDPQYADYFTHNDLVANNTVVIPNDSYNNTATTLGFLLQNSSPLRFMNNAVSILDNSIQPNTTSALVAYTGVGPSSETGLGLVSDRNAYWYTGSQTSLIRFIDIDTTGAVLEMAGNDAYKNLSQWRAWTNLDRNSVYGDFLKDMSVIGYNPGKLRLNLNPTPLGSILNNRGENLAEVQSDIDGQVRGSAERRFDIGADEFDGRVNISDLEVVDIIAPENYRSTSGIFSDAEYIMTTAPVEVSGIIRNNGSLIKQGAAVNIKIYQQLPNGTYNTTPVVEDKILSNFAPSTNMQINFKLADKVGEEFIPQTYAELRNDVPKYIVPTQFAAMEANVTPVYKIVINVEDDENSENNVVEKYVRFYLKKTPIDLLLNVENASANLNSSLVTADQVAGKLNADSLIMAFKYIGWKVDIEDSIYDYDLFDRSNWEPRAINYNAYRTMFYADGLNDGLNHQLRLDLEDFLNQGIDGAKRNLVIVSEEFVRNSTESDFTDKYLGTQNLAPGNPMGSGVSNNGNQVKGVAIARDFKFTIKETGFANEYIADVQPESGLLKLLPEGEGVRRTGFLYVNHPASGKNDVAAVAVNTLGYNTTTIATDWRHWGNLELFLRALIDYIENNDGNIIPVEMLSFDANAKGASVVLDWSTASEYNVNRFEVEKAEVTEAGITEFAKIDETKANGTGAITYYGPVIDNNVKMGSTYSYRLRIVDNDGAWSFSDAREVTLSGVNGAIAVEDITPNPIVSSGTLTVNLTEAMNVSIEVYDMSSAKVMTLANGALKSGLTTFNLNASELANGAYTVVVRSGEVTIMKNFTIVK